MYDGCNKWRYFMKEAFFVETQNAYKRITETFDLINPVLLCTWKIKSEIEEIYVANPKTPNSELMNRYNSQKKFHGVNYQKVFVKNDWSIFEENISWILLNMLFSIHEGWVSEMKNIVVDQNSRRKKFEFEKEMEFPNRILNQLKKCTEKKSELLAHNFENKLKKNKRYNMDSLNNLMYCYRYYKELRNCYVHNNIIVSEQLVNAYNDFAQLCNKHSLGIKSKPEIIKPIIGKKVNISIKGVISFSEVLLNILVTCDACLLTSSASESYFLKRIEKAIKNKRTHQNDHQKALKQVKSLCAKAGFPSPQDPESLLTYFIEKQIL